MQKRTYKKSPRRKLHRVSPEKRQQVARMKETKAEMRAIMEIGEASGDADIYVEALQKCEAIRQQRARESNQRRYQRRKSRRQLDAIMSSV